MQCLALFCALLLASPSFGAAAKADEHPIEKVIDLLKDLSDKVKTEGEKEEVSYAKFSHWCKNSQKTLRKAVETEKANIESLEEEVESKTKEKKGLERKIADLEKEITKLENMNSDADDIRDKEAKLYSKADKDFETTIKAIDDAIKAIQDEQDKHALLQIPSQVRRNLADLPLLLAQLTNAQQELILGSDIDVANAPAPPGIMAAGMAKAHEEKYSFKSGNVIELLKTLKTKFEDDRLDATKAETNALNAHALAKNAKDSAIAAAKDAKSGKETKLGDVKSDLSTAKGDLKNERDDLKADSKALEDNEVACDQKSSEWDERVKLRENEEKAIKAAIEILSDVSGVKTEQPDNPVPPPSPTLLEVDPLGSEAFSSLSFLQLPKGKQKALNLLREEAKRHHSKAFSRLVSKIEAGVALGGPFDKVNNMIQQMIFRLMAEQKDEDDHKNWCDVELEKTNTSKTNKEEKIDSLDKKIKAAKADEQLLADDIKDANEMVAKLDEFLGDITEVREVGKKENKEAIKDAKDAQSAIANAIAVLEQHYKDSGMMKKESWEFLQAPVKLPKEPSSWGASYTGAADPTKQPDGVIAVLKETAADFAKMEADTMAQEEMDQKAFEEDKKDSEIEKARRGKEAEMKEQEKKRLSAKITEMEGAKKHVSDELESVNQYLKDLAPACIEGDSTYEDRKAARDSEIAALKEAQLILAEYQDRDVSPSGAPGAAFLVAGGAPAPAPAFLAPVRRK